MESVTAQQRLILVLESQPEQRELIRHLLQESSQQYQIVTIADGLQAIDYLYQRGQYSADNAPCPDLMLLDLNLPGKSGHEVLAEIKADRQLRRIPIIVFSTSQQEEDILLTYKLQGNCYVVKSVDRENLTQSIQRIEQFWLGIVTLPKV